MSLESRLLSKQRILIALISCQISTQKEWQLFLKNTSNNAHLEGYYGIEN